MKAALPYQCCQHAGCHEMVEAGFDFCEAHCVDALANARTGGMAVFAFSAPDARQEDIQPLPTTGAVELRQQQLPSAGP